MIDDKKVTVMDAIDYFVKPSKEEEQIIRNAVTLIGIRPFLLGLEHYDLSEPVKTKLIDLRNIVEEFVGNMITEQEGVSGESG